MAAAKDRLGGIVDVADLLQAAGQHDEPCTDGATALGSIVHERTYSWGITRHSECGAEDDQLDGEKVYVDDESDKEDVIRCLVQSSRKEGLSESDATKLATIFEKYRSIFDFGWGNPAQPM